MIVFFLFINFGVAYYNVLDCRCDQNLLIILNFLLSCQFGICIYILMLANDGKGLLSYPKVNVYSLIQLFIFWGGLSFTGFMVLLDYEF